MTFRWWTSFAIWMVLAVVHATSNDNDLELDLVFPLRNGRYYVPQTGLPLILAVQNSRAAFEYGYNIWFDFDPLPREGSQRRRQTVILGHEFGAPAPANATDPYIVIDNVGVLRPGIYKVEWSINVQNWCRFQNTSQEISAEYSDNLSVIKGSINITILNEDEKSTADIIPTIVSGDEKRNCPLNLGVLSFASTATYTHLPLTVSGFGTETSIYTYTASAGPCVVTERVTKTADPCSVSVDRGVQTSLYKQMGWLQALNTATPSPSMSVSTSLSNSSIPSSASRAGSSIIMMVMVMCMFMLPGYW